MLATACHESGVKTSTKKAKLWGFLQTIISLVVRKNFFLPFCQMILKIYHNILSQWLGMVLCTCYMCVFGSMMRRNKLKWQFIAGCQAPPEPCWATADWCNNMSLALSFYIYLSQPPSLSLSLHYSAQFVHFPLIAFACGLAYFFFSF